MNEIIELVIMPLFAFGQGAVWMKLHHDIRKVDYTP